MALSGGALWRFWVAVVRMCSLPVIQRRWLYRSWRDMGRLCGMVGLAHAFGGGVEGPLCGVCVPIAGIWGSEIGGHVAIRGDVVSLG